MAATRGRARASNANFSELLGRLADEADAGDRGTNVQTNNAASFSASSRSALLATVERRRALRESFGLLGRTVHEPDTGENESARPSTSQATSTARYLDSHPHLINNSTALESQAGFNNSRDTHLPNRLRGYGAQNSRPGVSNSLVNESAVEARRLADRIEVLAQMNEIDREGRRNSGGSVGGGMGDPLDSRLRDLEADLRGNGMSSIGWNPFNRRPTNDLEAREDSRRLQEWTPSPWNHRQPPTVNHRSNYLPMPQHSILPLPNLPSNDDTEMTIGESIGFRPTDFTSGSTSSNNNTRNNQILSSSSYDSPGSSRAAGRHSDYFWLNSSRAASSNQNNMDTGISPELPSSASETDVFDTPYSAIADMVNTITDTSSSMGGGQRRHSTSSDSSDSSNVAQEARSNQSYLDDPPALPSPDLGGVFDAERHASSIMISDESPETIFVHPPHRDTSGISQTNPPSIPVQHDANPPLANNPYLRNFARHQSEIEAHIQRQRRTHVEARRISALAEEIRGMVGSSRSHRNTNIEPTERRNSRSMPSTASELPSARFQALDPSSFTPGPFRNTVQQLFNEHRHIQRRPDPTQSVPPTIPPLSFEDNDLSSLHQRIPFQHIRRPTGTAEATSASTRDVDVRREQVIAAIAEERRDQQGTSRPISDRIAATRRFSTLNENSRRRDQSDIYRYLTQQTRMEASRLDDPEAPVSSTISHRGVGDIQGINHVIDVLHHEGSNAVRSQQLIERFRRERESTRTRPTGTEPESTTPAGAPAGPRRPDGRRFLPASIMRREPGRTGDEERRSAFSSAVAQHNINQEEQRESEEMTGIPHSMRGRRARFPRLPPEVMYSLGRPARRGGGTFGDYIVGGKFSFELSVF